MLIHDSERQMLRIETASSCTTVLPVLEIIRHLLQGIIVTMFKNLRFAVLVSLPELGQDNFISLSYLEGGKSALGSTGIIAMTNFVHWIPSQGVLSAYDIFLSYRVKANRLFAAKFARGLARYESMGGQRRPEVFLDKTRLEAGEPFDVEFALALKNSAVMCVLISVGTLEKMVSPTDTCDNVLLEWWLSLVFMAPANQKQSRLRKLLPIICTADPLLVDAFVHGPAANANGVSKLSDKVLQDSVLFSKVIMSLFVFFVVYGSFLIQFRCVSCILRQFSNSTPLCWQFSNSISNSIPLCLLYFPIQFPYFFFSSSPTYHICQPCMPCKNY